MTKKLLAVAVLLALLGGCRSGSLLCLGPLRACSDEPIVEYPPTNPEFKRSK